MKHLYSIAALLVGLVMLASCRNPVDTTSSEDGWRLYYDGNGSDGGEVPVDDRIYQYEDTVIVLGNRGGLYKNGYRFIGWEKEGMLPAAEGDVFLFPGPGQDETLYAAWEYAPGSIDLAFHTGDGAGSSGSIVSALVLPDGKILVGGWFSSYNGSACKELVRLNPDGTLDSSFDLQPAVANGVETIAVQSDGYLVLGGFNLLTRVDSTGATDTGFAGPGPSNFWCKVIALQSDERILIGGSFDTFQGSTVGNFARLDTAGVLDGAFNNALQANSDVNCIEVLANDYIILAGEFTSLGTTPASHLARLSSVGSDVAVLTAGAGYGPNGTVTALALTADEGLLVGGNFSQYDATARPGLALAAGSCRLVGGFLSEAAATGAVAVLPDGKILAVERSKIHRLWPMQ